MLIMKIACGESAIKGDGIGDVHLAMLASAQFRVYVNGGMLPDGSDDAHFDELTDALVFAQELAALIIEEFVKENPL